MSTDKGKPAFPCETPMEIYSGMTLRDYFAAKALQGLLSSASGSDITSDGLANVGVQETVNTAYEYADAMLKASQS